MATTMQTIVGGAMSRPRAALVVAAAFALLAVLLAVIGVYGVIAFSVALRTRELAVRSALGASPRQLVAVVLGHSAGLGAVGCAAGLAIAWATTRGLSAMLFEVRPLDPSTFAAVVTGLLVLVVGAAAIPATHAACVSPAEALRRE
jgi:ABC-type antimicrobial peptide transport system permease subunit